MIQQPQTVNGFLVSIVVLYPVLFAREAKRQQELLKAVTAKIEDLEKQSPEGVFIEGAGERAKSEVRHGTVVVVHSQCLLIPPSRAQEKFGSCRNPY